MVADRARKRREQRMARVPSRANRRHAQLAAINDERKKEKARLAYERKVKRDKLLKEHPEWVSAPKEWIEAMIK